MQILTVIMLASVFALSNIGTWLIAIPAYAGCCRCNMPCGGGCYCPGTGGCAYCAIPESAESPSLKAAVYDEMKTFDADRGSVVPAISITPESIDRMIRLAGTRQCDRKNFRLNLTDGQKPLSLDERYLKAYAIGQEDSTAIQLVSNARK
jgi:hypothetical protein